MKISSLIRGARKLFITSCPTIKTTLVDADDSLFCFARKHALSNSKGEILDDGIILTHISNYLPYKGEIQTARSAIQAVRDSVHFAANHGVVSHSTGNWENMKNAVLIPLKSAFEQKKNHFVGGTAVDLYSRGNVKLPKGSIIVRYNSQIPSGKYRIQDASKIEELRKLRGVKLIETSNPNIVQTVNNVIKKLGYDLKDNSSICSWGNKFEDPFVAFGKFNNFLKKMGLKIAMHTYTPNGKCELLLENIYKLSKCKIPWKTKDGVNLKKEVISALKYIDRKAKKEGYELNFDVKHLIHIVAGSKTPREAVDKLTKLGYKATIMNPKFISDLANKPKKEVVTHVLYISKLLVESKNLKSVEHYIDKFLAKPSAEYISEIEKITTTKQYQDINRIINR